MVKTGSDWYRSKIRVPLILFVSFFIMIFALPSFSMTESDQLLFKRALRFAGASKFTSAGKILKNLSVKYKDNDLISFNLANTFYMNKKYKQASRYYYRVYRNQSNLAIPAGIYLLRTYVKTGRFKQARRLLIRLPRPQLEGLAKEWDGSKEMLVEEMIFSGLKFYEKRQFLPASKRFRSVLNIDKNNAQALYLLGLSEKQRGKNRRSRYYLKRALNNSSKSERRTISRIIENIGNESGRGRNVTISSLMRRDSNYFREKTNEPQEALSLTHSTSFSLFEKEANGAFYATVLSASLEDYFDVEEQDFGDIDIRAPISIPWELSDLIISPKFYASWFDSDSYTLRPGVQIRFTHKFDEFSGGFDFRYDRTIPQSSGFSYLEGNDFKLRGFAFLPGNFSYFVSAGIRNTSGDDFQADGFSVPQAFAGPEFTFRVSTSAFKANFSAGFDVSLFRYKNNYQPEDDVRTDRNLNANILVDFKLNETIQMDLGLDYSNRDSTMISSIGIDKNFTQWVYSVGLTWDVWL